MDYLKAFNQVVNALETHQNDLKDLIQIRSDCQRLLNQLKPIPENQEQIRRISKDLQYADKLIVKCQTAIQVFSQALSSPNPN